MNEEEKKNLIAYRFQRAKETLLEAEAMIATMASADHREAAAAFVEKRDPRFRGF